MRATREQIRTLADTIASQAEAISDHALATLTEQELHAKAQLLKDNVDTLTIWTGN